MFLNRKARLRKTLSDIFEKSDFLLWALENDELAKDTSCLQESRKPVLDVLHRADRLHVISLEGLVAGGAKSLADTKFISPRQAFGALAHTKAEAERALNIMDHPERMRIRRSADNRPYARKFKAQSDWRPVID